MPTKYNRPTRRVAAVFAWACSSLLAAARVEAQWALGPWDDATVLPRGVLRTGLATWWTRSNERFERTSSRLESLGAAFARDSLGPDVFASIGALDTPLQTLSGLASPPLSLGRLQVDFEETSYIVPIALDYGLTSRLTLSALIPYVKTRAELFANPNPLGPDGTLGVNPALGLAGARSRNTLVFSQLSTAATTLTSELARCLNSTDPSCAAINADRSAAAALATATGATASAIAAVYGINASGTTPATPGSPFVPVGSRALQTAVDTRLGALSTQLESLLGVAPGGAWITERPVGAAPLGFTDFQSVLTDSAFGILGRTLTDIERSHVGDIEVGAKLLLLDTFGAAIGREPVRGGGARLAVAGVVRLGTGQRDTPEDFADIGTGDRQQDIEVRGFLDLVAGRRWWTSIVARYGRQLADRVTMRVPTLDGPSRLTTSPFLPGSRQFEIDRDLGDYLELEVAPRFSPNPNFSFSGNYRVRRKENDRYGSGDCSAVDATFCAVLDLLGDDTGHQEQRIGWALTYSTLRGYTQRRAPWPLEVSLAHTQVLSGRGVRKEFETAVMLRLYRQFSGRDALRPVTR